MSDTPSADERPPDIGIREFLPQLLHTLIGNMGFMQDQFFKIHESLKMNQPSIGDLGIVKVKNLEVCQIRQVSKTGVGNLGACQAEPPRFRQIFQMRGPFIGDRGRRCVQPLDARQSIEVGKPAIRSARIIKVKAGCFAIQLRKL